MPYRTGCAVDLRFSIAQLVGARYERYAQNLTEIAEKELGIRGIVCSIDVDSFLRPENKITPEKAAAVQSVPAKPVIAGRSCPKCGNAVADNALFCVKCGTKLAAEAPRFCNQCGTKLAENALFCSHCGNKVR
ncbi:MAG: zinc ribbon domain-containing protein [Clostridiales bacterium]|nr:zinc ribbon domain-containing protein [Clostridiales bacterium]